MCNPVYVSDLLNFLEVEIENRKLILFLSAHKHQIINRYCVSVCVYNKSKFL